MPKLINFKQMTLKQSYKSLLHCKLSVRFLWQCGVKLIATSFMCVDFFAYRQRRHPAVDEMVIFCRLIHVRSLARALIRDTEQPVTAKRRWKDSVVT
jgi:hypothetical protein